MKILLAVLAVCLLIPLNASGQKIVADPNESQAAKSATTEASDERLAQKITYQSTDKRLYTVVAELSEKTGVVVYCGKDDEDWHVRDLPVVISWKDMPLGKLLQAITNSTHTTLTHSTVDNKLVYRIVADEQARKQVVDDIANRRKSLLELASWEWDAWAAFGALPDDSVKSTGVEGMQVGSGAYQVARDIAQIISKLEPGSKKEIFGGGTITLSATQSPFAQLISELYNDWWSLRQEGYMQFVSQNQDLIRENPEIVIDDPKTLTEADLNKASLSLELRNGDAPALVIKLDGPEGSVEDPFPNPREWVSELAPGLPPAPQIPAVGGSGAPDSFTDFDQENPQSNTIAQTKVKLTRPADGQDICFADVVTALAEAGGYSVVCEDFRSHCDDPRANTYSAFYGTEINMSDILSELQSSGDSVKWYIDKQDKLVLGSSTAWYERHERLVPERFIALLRDKLNGPGVDIDDAVAIMRLTEGQYLDWVKYAQDLKAIAWECMPRDEPIWRFYDSLSAEDKTQAKTESGLALAKFDSKLLVTLFEEVENGVVKQDSWGMVRLAKSSPEFVRQHPELNGSVIIPTDPDVLSHLTLYIRSQDIKPMIESGYKSKDMAKKRYAIEIKGDGVAMKFEGPMLNFPVCSKKREQNVREENTGLTENKQ